MNNLSKGIITVNGKEINRETTLADLWGNADMKVSSRNKNADFKYVYFKSDKAYVDGKPFQLKGFVYNYRITKMELYPNGTCSTEYQWLKDELGHPDFDEDDIRAWNYPWGNIIEEDGSKAPVLTIGYC